MSRATLIVQRLLEDSTEDKDWLMQQEPPEVPAATYDFNDPVLHRWWRMRVVPKGGRYGRDNKLFHMERDPLVEFWDMHQADQGQFVARYTASTLLNRRNPDAGIDLQCDVSVWKLSAPAMDTAMRRLREFMDYYTK